VLKVRRVRNERLLLSRQMSLRLGTLEFLERRSDLSRLQKWAGLRVLIKALVNLPPLSVLSFNSTLRTVLQSHLLCSLHFCFYRS
jgi:hypothetical protein